MCCLPVLVEYSEVLFPADAIEYVLERWPLAAESVEPLVAQPLIRVVIGAPISEENLATVLDWVILVSGVWNVLILVKGVKLNLRNLIVEHLFGSKHFQFLFARRRYYSFAIRLKLIGR